MALQTLSGKPVTSENALSPNNFRPYSRQAVDKIRLQPDALGAEFALKHRPDSDNAKTQGMFQRAGSAVRWFSYTLPTQRSAPDRAGID
jgi:hypothetical protein